MSTEIRIFLLRNKLTCHKIASRLGISQTYVHLILTNKTKAWRIRRALVEQFGFPPELAAYNPPYQEAA
jgi:hypothetical protein